MSNPTVPKGPYAFFNFPEPLATQHKYVAPPKGANPVVRGAILSIGAPLIEKLGFASRYLYNNAGFDKLRKLEVLEDAEHRFDPTVIPLRDPAEEGRPPLYTDEASLRKVAYTGGDANKYYSVADFHEAYKSGKTTPRKVIDVLLPLIRRDVKDKSEHAMAFLETKVELVIAAADASTRRWAEGTPLGVLDGVPVAVKDELDVKGYGKTLARRGFLRRVPKKPAGVLPNGKRPEQSLSERRICTRLVWTRQITTQRPALREIRSIEIIILVDLVVVVVTLWVQG
jgi:hypothetical protein